MPELPEVETICRGLAHYCVGAKVLSAHVHRPEFILGDQSPRSLFTGLTIARVIRHGKQFIMESSCGRIMLFHMGMSGCVTILPFQSKPAPHVHVRWTLTLNGKKFEMHHKDPRRFGWLHTHENMQVVREIAWSKLGPDALEISPDALFQNVQNRRCAVKAALLNQSVVAGVGNIYADESLFQSRIHPLRKANSISFSEISNLVKQIQIILKNSIRGGGSTIQNHANALGKAGTFQQAHKVYGRADEPCVVCGALLKHVLCAQRSTVFCGHCQPKRPSKT